MKKLIVGLLVGFLLASSVSYAREIISEFSDDEISVLNEELRKIWDAIDNVSVYGNMCVDGNTDDTGDFAGAGVANKLQYLHFDTNGDSNDTTPNHLEDHITIKKAGKYFIIASIHLESSAGGGDIVGFEVWKNNGTIQLKGLHGHRELGGGGGDVGAATISGVADLSVGDTIELWVYNDDDVDAIQLNDVSMTVTKYNG